MNIVNPYRNLFLFFIMGVVCPLTAAAQNGVDTTKKEPFSIQKGTILTGFSLGWTTASRDDYNFEFERWFTRLDLQVDALYFFNGRIGAGTILGYQYLFRDLENNPGTVVPRARDTWEWDFEYGAKAGWYAPVHVLFGTGSLKESMLYVTAGVSWLRRRYRVEGYNKSGGINKNRFGYQVASGLLIPLGRQIALETKVQWEARRTRYVMRATDRNGNTRTIDEIHWPSVLSVGVGLKVAFSG